MNSKLRDILVRLISSAVGLKLANAEDYKEFVPTAEKAIRQAVGEEMLEIIGEVDNSPQYFAELYKGQARDAAKYREGSNSKIAELRQKIKEWSEADTQDQSNEKDRKD